MSKKFVAITSTIGVAAVAAVATVLILRNHKIREKVDDVLDEMAEACTEAEDVIKEIEPEE